jgi:hypothetical protein
MALVQINRRADTTFDKKEIERFCRLQTDHMWIITHKTQLRKEYPNKFVAVENQTVRFVAKDMNKLITSISKNHKPIDDYAIDFISQHPTNLLL